jgi:hypothetical protein
MYERVVNTSSSAVGSQLSIDSDGQVGLYGTIVNGGVKTDSNGNTCLGGDISLYGCPGANTLDVSGSGVVNSYRGQALAGSGLQAIMATGQLTTSTITTIFTTTTSTYIGGEGLYQLDLNVLCTSGGSTSTILLQVGYDDPYEGSESQDSGYPQGTAWNCSTGNTFSQTLSIESDGSSDGAQAITIRGFLVNSPSFKIRYSLKSDF